MIVTLTWAEQILAAQCGVLRNVEALRLGCRREYSRKLDHATATNIDAAGAEMAVAKMLGRYWLAGVNEFDIADVAPNLEVRHTQNSNGRLIVRRDAPEDRPFFLVRGTMPRYEIVGWIWACDAKRKEWLDDPNGDGPCYMVPADQLRRLKADLVEKEEDSNGYRAALYEQGPILNDEKEDGE